MKKIDLARHAPPGIKLEWEKQFFVVGWVGSALVSLGFPVKYFNLYSDLYFYSAPGVRELDVTRVMPDFYEILGGCLRFYIIFAVCMLLLIVYHYAFHYLGSKSIYTMRRLPNKWELHRRCLTLPIASALILLISAAVTLLLWFGIYMLCTPEQCLMPDQWTKLWEAILHA
ncbi:MAG: hypothetical protein E7430_02765 [Ruminococcaceae bacterium]|nr:hypothetical protein [Oscillospiraceae bacterium]